MMIGQKSQKFKGSLQDLILRVDSATWVCIAKCNIRICRMLLVELTGTNFY